ncbi:MAG: GerMN domain-containing protein [Bacillota bacterium]
MSKMKKINFLLIFLLGLAIFVAIYFPLRYNNFAPAEREREVLVYFSDKDANYLVSEKRMVSAESVYNDTLKELIKGPKNENLIKTIPDGVEVIDFKLENNIIRINFNEALQKNHWGGSSGEIMTVYSIVNTMTQFDKISQVEFLIEGVEIETLSGHMDLSRPLGKNNKIIDE